MRTEPTTLPTATVRTGVRMTELVEAKQAAYRALHNLAALEANPLDVATLAAAARLELAATLTALDALEDDLA